MVRRGDNLATFMCRLSRNCASLNLRALKACLGLDSDSSAGMRYFDSIHFWLAERRPLKHPMYWGLWRLLRHKHATSFFTVQFLSEQFAPDDPLDAQHDFLPVSLLAFPNPAIRAAGLRSIQMMSKLYGT